MQTNAVIPEAIPDLIVKPQKIKQCCQNNLSKGLLKALTWNAAVRRHSDTVGSRLCGPVRVSVRVLWAQWPARPKHKGFYFGFQYKHCFYYPFYTYETTYKATKSNDEPDKC